MCKIEQEKVQKLDELIRNSSKYSIVVHTRPDGDALGSATALVNYLKSKNCKIVLSDNVPEYLRFTINPSSIINDLSEAKEWIQTSDLIFCLDFNNFSRTSVFEELLKNSQAKKVLIDHHLNPDTNSFDLIFSEAEISSTCELLYYMLIEFNKDLAINISSPLMVGMTTDTNNFANSVYPSTLSMASHLLELGVDRDNILTHLYNEYEENRLRAMGHFLYNKMIITDLGIAYTVFDQETIKQYQLKEGQTEGFVNLPLGIKNVKISLFLKEEEGLYRVSIRSKKGYSAALLASEYFNGGGHTNAAGGKLLVGKDIAAPELIYQYIESSTAQFMRKYYNDENE